LGSTLRITKSSRCTPMWATKIQSTMSSIGRHYFYRARGDSKASAGTRLARRVARAWLRNFYTRRRIKMFLAESPRVHNDLQKQTGAVCAKRHCAYQRDEKAGARRREAGLIFKRKNRVEMSTFRRGGCSSKIISSLAKNNYL